MIDKNQLTQMYEQIRSAALRSSKAVKGRHSFGQVVLAQKGVVAWAKTCCQLQFCAPSPKPIHNIIGQTAREQNIDEALKNILTGMALKAIEGGANVNVSGI